MSDNALLISTRKRVVWTRDEKKLLTRVSKVFNEHGDKFRLICGSVVCPSPSIEMVQDDTDPAGRVLQCGCTSRHFSRTA